MRILPASQVWHKPAWEHFAKDPGGSKEWVHKHCLPWTWESTSNTHTKKFSCYLKYKLNWCPVFYLTPTTYMSCWGGSPEVQSRRLQTLSRDQILPAAPFLCLSPWAKMDFTSIKGCVPETICPSLPSLKYLPVLSWPFIKKMCVDPQLVRGLRFFNICIFIQREFLTLH